MLTSGDHLLEVLAALANPHRARVIATLLTGRRYVSQLARELGISRPLVQVHLRRLEAAGLVTAAIEVSDEGTAMKYYQVNPFAIELTPQSVAEAARTLGGSEP